MEITFTAFPHTKYNKLNNNSENIKEVKVPARGFSHLLAFEHLNNRYNYVSMVSLKALFITNQHNSLNTPVKIQFG